VATVRHAFRQHVAALGEGIAGPRQGGAAEGQRQTVEVADDLDHVRVEQGFDVFDRLGQGGHARFGVGGEVGGNLIDHAWRDQRLVTLHVDHDGIGRQAKFCGDFGQAIGAGVMVFAGQHRLGAKPLAGFDDARIVGGHHHTLGAAFAGLFPHPLDHRLVADELQRLARQTGRCVAGRNDNGKGGGHLSRRSSVVRVRASLSSITGMPSRIG